MATLEAMVGTILEESPELLETLAPPSIITPEMVQRERFRLAARSCSVNGVDFRGSFAEDVLRSHADLISKWNGTRFHSPLYESEFVDVDAVHNIVYAETIAASRHLPLCDYNSPNYEWSHAWWGENFTRHLTSREAPADVTIAYNFFQHTVEIRKGQVISRAILRDIKKRNKDKDPTELELYLAMWEKIFSRIGDLWSVRNGIRITASVSPHDFSWLGDLEVESGRSTCYRTNGEWEWSKYNLAQIKNSFVLLYYRTPSDTEGDPNNLLFDPAIQRPDGRCWGFYNDKGIYLSNQYGVSWATIRQLVPQFAEDAFSIVGAEEIAFTDTLYPITREISGDHCYVNGDATFFGVTSGTSPAINTIRDNIRGWLRNGDPYGYTSVECHSCGYDEMAEGETYGCERCSEHFCSSCVVYCETCDLQYCNSCGEFESCGTRIGQFSRCGHRECSNCQVNGAMCEQCNEYICTGCIRDEARNCDACGTTLHEHCADEALTTCEVEGCGAQDENVCPGCECIHATENRAAEAAERARLADLERMRQLEEEAYRMEEQRVRDLRAAFLVNWKRERLNAAFEVYDALSVEERRDVGPMPLRGCVCDGCMGYLTEAERTLNITPPPAPEIPNV